MRSVQNDDASTYTLCDGYQKLTCCAYANSAYTSVKLLIYVRNGGMSACPLHLSTLVTLVHIPHPSYQYCGTDGSWTKIDNSGWYSDYSNDDW